MIQTPCHNPQLPSLNITRPSQQYSQRSMVNTSQGSMVNGQYQSGVNGQYQSEVAMRAKISERVHFFRVLLLSELLLEQLLCKQGHLLVATELQDFEKPPHLLPPQPLRHSRSSLATYQLQQRFQDQGHNRMVLALPKIHPQLAELQSREGTARIGPLVPEQVDGGEQAAVEYLSMGEGLPGEKSHKGLEEDRAGLSAVRGEVAVRCSLEKGHESCQHFEQIFMALVARPGLEVREGLICYIEVTWQHSLKEVGLPGLLLDGWQDERKGEGLCLIVAGQDVAEEGDGQGQVGPDQLDHLDLYRFLFCHFEEQFQVQFVLDQPRHPLQHCPAKPLICFPAPGSQGSDDGQVGVDSPLAGLSDVSLPHPLHDVLDLFESHFHDMRLEGIRWQAALVVSEQMLQDEGSLGLVQPEDDQLGHLVQGLSSEVLQVGPLSLDQCQRKQLEVATVDEGLDRTSDFFLLLLLLEVVEQVASHGCLQGLDLFLAHTPPD